jgi:hypothetical protein
VHVLSNKECYTVHAQLRVLSRLTLVRVFQHHSSFRGKTCLERDVQRTKIVRVSCLVLTSFWLL